MEFEKNRCPLKNRIRLMVCFATVCLSVPESLAARAPGEQLALNLRDNIVGIVAELPAKTNNGFGFIVGERNGYIYIATANHVVRGKFPGERANNVKVEFYSQQGTFYPATLLSKSLESKDLAVLKAKKQGGLSWAQEVMSQVLEPKRGTPVWFIGRTGRWYVPSQPGTVNMIDINDQIWVDGLNLMVGTSGAPLIGESGIMGMIVSDEPGGVSHAMHIRIIKRAFGEWNYPWDLKALPSPTSTEPSKPESKIPRITPQKIDISGTWSWTHGGFISFIGAGGNRYEFTDMNALGVATGYGVATLEGKNLTMSGVALGIPFTGRFEVTSSRMNGYVEMYGNKAPATMVR